MKNLILGIAVLGLSVPAYAANTKSPNFSLQQAKDLAARQFTVYDQDKSGSVDMKEYRVPFDALTKAKKINPDANSIDQKAINESFARMDKNKDSGISKDEFMADAELRHKTMDTNKDGVVTPQELAELQKKIQDAHKKAIR